ncbi:MAG: ATP-binding protein [Cyclobacteriaceae bacterium]
MRFSDIPGLHDVKSSLSRAVEGGHVAHAQMFLGDEGSGNLALAMAMGALLTCDNPQDGDACGVCPSCVKNAKLIHPDVHYIFPVSPVGKITGKDAISTSFLTEWRKFAVEMPYGNAEDWSFYFGGENKQLNISKEESRNIIRSLTLKSFEGKYKVMIIWQPEYLHPNAANGILKILEEPAEKTVFILVAYDQEKLLGTIKSRTQTFRIRSFNDEEIAQTLVATKEIDPYKAQQIAHIAAGNLREAYRLSDDTADDHFNLFRDWMRACFKPNTELLLDQTEGFFKMSKTAQKSLFQYGLGILRECVVLTGSQPILNRLAGEELEFAQKFNSHINLPIIEKIAMLFDQALYHIERNANAKILFLDISYKISAFLKSKQS